MKRQQLNTLEYNQYLGNDSYTQVDLRKKSSERLKYTFGTNRKWIFPVKSGCV